MTGFRSDPKQAVPTLKIDNTRGNATGSENTIRLEILMKNPSEYVKMRVLAAIDMAEGNTITQRIRQVSTLTFEDEEGQRHRFTFRTIETWRLRYKKHGFTAICPKERSDKGKTRKISPERLLEAIEQAKPFFRDNDFNLAELYRTCIEKGLLRREQIAPNTFRRLVKKLELLKPDKDVTNQRRLCILAGQPGTGKTILRQAFAQSSDHLVTPYITRTMHTYANILRILCQALGIEHAGSDLKCEDQVIHQMRTLHHKGKAIALTIDDAHLTPPQHLRKLRLLLEESPGNYGILLFAQIELLATLALAVNADLHSRTTYSALLHPLTPEDIQTFILRELDTAGLAHSRIDPAALHLIAHSAGGILRHAVHLTTSSLIQAVRTAKTTVTTQHVNTALMQPHWRDHDYWITQNDD